MDYSTVKGKSFSRIIGNVIYVMVIDHIEEAGEMVQTTSYIGKKTMIFSDGHVCVSDWASDKKIFDKRVKDGTYNFIGQVK